MLFGSVGVGVKVKRDVDRRVLVGNGGVVVGIGLMSVLVGCGTTWVVGSETLAVDVGHDKVLKDLGGLTAVAGVGGGEEGSDGREKMLVDAESLRGGLEVLSVGMDILEGDEVGPGVMGIDMFIDIPLMTILAATNSHIQDNARKEGI